MPLRLLSASLLLPLFTSLFGVNLRFAAPTCARLIANAFSTLSDSKKRQLYDKYGDQVATAVAAEQSTMPTAHSFGRSVSISCPREMRGPDRGQSSRPKTYSKCSVRAVPPNRSVRSVPQRLSASPPFVTLTCRSPLNVTLTGRPYEPRRPKQPIEDNVLLQIQQLAPLCERRYCTPTCVRAHLWSGRSFRRCAKAVAMPLRITTFEYPHSALRPISALRSNS